MDVKKRLIRDAESFAEEVAEFGDTEKFLSRVFKTLGISSPDDASSISASPAGRNDAAGRAGADLRAGQHPQATTAVRDERSS